jgi:hypothetical protein
VKNQYPLGGISGMIRANILKLTEFKKQRHKSEIMESPVRLRSGQALSAIAEK